MEQKMLKDCTATFQEIRAVRDLEIHLILSLHFSSEETGPERLRSLPAAYTEMAEVHLWFEDLRPGGTLSITLLSLSLLRSSYGRALSVGRIEVTDYNRRKRNGGCNSK